MWLFRALEMPIKNLKNLGIACLCVVCASIIAAAIVYAAYAFCPRYQWVIGGGILDTRSGTMYRQKHSRGNWEEDVRLERSRATPLKDSEFWEDDARPIPNFPNEKRR